MFLRRLGKRGTAIVEYAIILAFAAAVGSSFTSDNGMTGSIKSIIGNVNQMLGVAAGKEESKHPEFNFDEPSSNYKDAVINVVDTMYQSFNIADRPLASVEWGNDGRIKYVQFYKNGHVADDIDKDSIANIYGVSNISSLFSGSSVPSPTYGGYLAFDREGNLLKTALPNGNGSQFTHMSFDYDGSKSILIEGNNNSSGGVDFTKLSTSKLSNNGMLKGDMKYYIE